ncbi:MAG: hypothetical protein M5R40_27695 [Anaerolineae bacterium]|nr:hypothetical protein [Anaerolineae bacterium]
MEGLFQNDHFAVVYSGQWVFFTNAQASGGSIDYTDDIDATVSFEFNANTITIYRTLGPSRAIMRVLIDGVPIGSAEQDGIIDNYSPTVRYAVPYRVTGLAAGVHEITIEHTGTHNPSATGNFLDIDAFAVENVATVSGGTYQDTDPAISYAGSWARFDTTNANAGSVYYTTQAGDAAYVIFSGANAIEIGYAKHRFMGILDIYLDGELIQTLNCYEASAVWQVPFFYAGIDPSETHVLEIRNNGARDPLATDNYTYIDWITIIPKLHDANAQHDAHRATDGPV